MFISIDLRPVDINQCEAEQTSFFADTHKCHRPSSEVSLAQLSFFCLWLFFNFIVVGWFYIWLGITFSQSWRHVLSVNDSVRWLMCLPCFWFLYLCFIIFTFCICHPFQYDFVFCLNLLVQERRRRRLSTGSVLLQMSSRLLYAKH